MNNTEISADVCVPLQLFLVLSSQFSHGPFELGDDRACGHVSCGKNAKFRFSGTVGITRRVRYLNGPRGQVEFEITRCMTSERMVSENVQVAKECRQTWRRRLFGLEGTSL
jgi:hypothetical protein